MTGRTNSRVLVLASLLGVSGACGSEDQGPKELGAQQQGAVISCTKLQLASSVSGVVPVDSATTLTASFADCASTDGYEFRFLYRADHVTTYSDLQAYGLPTATFDTTGLASGRYLLRVLARQLGSTASYQALAELPMLIGSVCMQPALSASPASPSAADSIGLTASSSCTGGTAEYRLSMTPMGSSTSTELRTWGSSSYAWDTSSVTPGLYRLRVDSRAVGNNSTSEGTGFLWFDVGESCINPGLVTIPVTGAVPGASVTLIGGATCTGSASPQFKFSYVDPTTNVLTAISGWSTSSATWDTTGLPPGDYSLRVETRANDGDHGTQASKTVKYVIGGVCGSLSANASFSDPTLSLSASASCTTDATPEYRFVANYPDEVTSVDLNGGFTASSTATLDTTGLPAGRYTFTVETRSAARGGAAQASTTTFYDVGATCTTLTSAMSPKSYQPSGTKYSVTALATCTSGNAKYRFSYRAPSSSTWTVFRDWQSETNATLNTAGQPVGTGYVRVEARHEDSLGIAQSSNTLGYALTAACATGTSPNGAGGCTQTCAAQEGDTCFDILQVSASPSHACAVLSDGRVRCWGNSNAGQAGWNDTQIFDFGLTEYSGGGSSAKAISGLSGVESVVTAEGYSCAVLTNGTVRCWGGDPFFAGGDDDPIAGLISVSQLAAGGFHVCALLTNGTVRCWGDNSDGQAPGGSSSAVGGAIAGLADVTQISAGELHTCARLSDGTVRCFGSNANGQTAGSSATTAIEGLTDVEEVAAGDTFTCARLTGGTVRCWGTMSGYDGTTAVDVAYETPTEIAGLSDAVALSATGDGACARLANGSVECVDRFARVARNLPDAASITGGYGSGCALLTDGKVECWGDIGSGMSTVPGLPSVLNMDGGWFSMCAVISNASVRCWGYAGDDWSSYPTSVTTSIAGLSSVTQVSVGASHACARLSNGTVRCWGGPDEWLAGSNPTTPVAGLGYVSQVVTGNNFACARLSNGTVRCWGGGPDQTAGSTPTTSIPGLTGVTQLSAGDGYTCARLTNGTVRCWGEDTDGQLGGSSHLSPIAGLTGVQEVSASYKHACARLSDGSVRCWSDTLTAYAQDFYGTSTLPIMNLSNVVQLASGYYHTCARLSDGTVRCWGNDQYGQCGNSNTASPVPGLTGVVDITGGLHFTCARLNTGVVKCWGSNEGGVLTGARQQTSYAPPVSIPM